MSSLNPNESIPLTSDIAFKLKNKRISLGYTQDDVSRAAGISSKKYSRIETMKSQTIELETLYILAEILDLDMESIFKRFDTRVSFSVSEDLKKELEFLRDSKNISTLSDTIKYCINFTLHEFYMEKISVTLLDEIKEMLDATYNDQLYKLSLQNNIKDIILKNFANNNDYELLEIEEDLKRVFLNYYRVAKEK